MSKERPNPDKKWVRCPQGTIAKMAAQQKLALRRELLAKIGTGAVTIAAIGTAGTIYLATRNPQNRKLEIVMPISCTEVINLLPEYVVGEIDDKTLLARLEHHLNYCQPCIVKRDEMTV